METANTNQPTPSSDPNITEQPKGAILRPSKISYPLTVLILLFLLVLGAGSYYSKQITNKPQTPINIQTKSKQVKSSGENVLIYNIEGLSGEKEQPKAIYAYDLDTKAKTAFDSDKINSSPEIINKALFSQSFPDEILFLSDKNDTITFSKYTIKNKKIEEIASISKAKILEINDWRDFSFSPDKTSLVYGSLGMGIPAHIYLLNLSTQQDKLITKGDSDTSPKWLDNKHLLYERRNTVGKDSLWIFNIDTGSEEMLVDISQNEVPNTIFSYTYTQDGKKVIFSSHHNTHEEDIFEIDVHSKQISKLFHLPHYDFTTPQITANSRYLVWSSLLTGEYTSRSIFSYDLTKGVQDTICVSSQDWCGDFYIVNH